MNAKQRNRLSEIYSQLEQLESELTDMRDGEEAKFDNMSEGLQQSEGGQKIEAAKEALDTACTAIEELKTAIEEARDA